MRAVRLVPVLIDDAKMPRREDLPIDVWGLARLNTLEMSYCRYEYASSRLIAVIEKALSRDYFQS